jgi:hypothetical protein
MGKPKKPTKTQRQKGQIVMDFANAETTDAACLEHFENMQKLMAFSTDFAERMKEAYPAFYPLYSSLTESERGFIKLILREDSCKYLLNQDLEALAYEIDRYDPETSILTVWELGAHADFHDGLASGGFFRDKRFEMTVEEFKDEIEGHVGGMLQGGFLDDLDDYIEIEKQMPKAKPSFTEGRISELQELSSQYGELDRLRSQIASIQKGLKNILDGIVQGKNFDDISELTYYIKIYNNLPAERVSSLGGVLTEHPPIEEKDYLEGGKSKWATLAERALAYCLVDFLTPVGNRNYIYRCDNCQDYYIPKKMHDSGHTFCTAQCRYSFHHSKPEYKEKKAAAQREKHGWKPKVHAK